MTIQSVRGMRDILPAEARAWRTVERAVCDVLDAHSYEEVRLPLLEATELFARGVGEATDIVEKEMYTLADRDGGSLTLRPEGTASCVRALQEHGLLFNQTQRVFYSGPMFRYERPQKGRYRQFYQVGAEAFGFAGPDIDAELIALGARFWQRLGIDQSVRLELNTLGSSEARQAYREALVSYLTPYRNDLDADSQRRLQTNPLRILDSKSESTQKLLSEAPSLPDYVDAQARAHFDGLQQLLGQLRIPYNINTTLVRGLDYYTHTVFEWQTDALGAQGAVCAGGRYDGLVERLGGKPTPAAGFGLGLDRVALLVEAAQQAAPGQNETVEPGLPVDVYICSLGDHIAVAAMRLAQDLRDALPGIKVRTHMGGGAAKKQLKRADVSGATWALVLGADEVAAGEVSLKHLRDAQFGQQRLPVSAAIEQISKKDW